MPCQFQMQRACGRSGPAFCLFHTLKFLQETYHPPSWKPGAAKCLSSFTLDLRQQTNLHHLYTSHLPNEITISRLHQEWPVVFLSRALDECPSASLTFYSHQAGRFISLPPSGAFGGLPALPYFDLFGPTEHAAPLTVWTDCVKGRQRPSVTRLAVSWLGASFLLRSRTLTISPHL